MFQVACDPVGKELDVGDTGSALNGADAVWTGQSAVGVGTYLAGGPSELAVGTQVLACGDSGTCTYDSGSSWVLHVFESADPGVAGVVVAHIAASQIIFVDDIDGDGERDLIAGMKEDQGAALLSGEDFVEIAVYGAVESPRTWLYGMGIGNSIPSGVAMVVQNSSGDNDKNGIFMYDVNRRGSFRLDESDALYHSNQRLSHYDAGIGDLDGDGLDDLAVRLSSAAAGCTGVSITLAPFEGIRDATDDEGCIVGVPGGIGPVVPLVDMDLDGHLDLLAGDWSTVFLFRGPVAQSSGPADAATSVHSPRTIWSFDGIGDFDGDGLQDLALGAVDDSKSGGSDGPGQVYVMLAPAGDLDITDWDFRFGGTDLDGWFGYALTGVGDINMDGRDELAVGAPGVNKQSGAVYLFLGE